MSCQYMYDDGEIVFRDDRGKKINGSLIDQSDDSKQWIGLKDDLAGVMDLLTREHAQNIIVLDKAFRSAAEVRGEISTVLSDRVDGAGEDFDTFQGEMQDKFTGIETTFDPHMD